MFTMMHLEMDESSERSNKTAIETLWHYVNRHQSDWMNHLIHIEIAMNNSVNATTKITSTQLLFDINIHLFPSFRFDTIDIHISTISKFIERINESIAIAKDNHLTTKII